MQTSITFKNLDSSEHLTEYVTTKLNRFDRYLDNPAEANVVLSVEKFRHIAEVNITGDRLNIYGKEETEDMYSAIDMVLDKLYVQIKKNKEKVRTKRGVANRTAKELMQDAVLTPAPDRDPKVRIQSIDFKPMDVEEAVMQMDLIENSFLVFTNSKSDRVNVLYRRKDGDYGLIQPTS
jgi:putative sigma-54 modulation protein